MTTDVTHQSAPPLGVAFLGGGFMTEVHSRAARAAGARIVGVASSSEESAKRACDRLGLGAVYSTVEELLADTAINLVHVCTPNSTHTALATAVLAAGKHVVCEKPLATSVDDAQALTDLASESGLVAVVPFVYRFHSMVREARARVRNGQVGEVLTIQGSYLQDWLLSSEDDDWRVNERFGGPSRAFADIGSHLCDLVEFILDDRIARLNAITLTVFGKRARTSNVTTEDAVSLLFETTRGAHGTLLISQMAAGRKNRLALELHGTAESLYFDQENPEQLWVGKRTGSQLLVRDPESLDPSAARFSVLPAGHPQGYQDAFNALIADTHSAIRGAVVDGLPVFSDGLRAAILTEAVLESNRIGDWVAPAAEMATDENYAHIRGEA